jgi:hypothetical protein
MTSASPTPDEIRKAIIKIGLPPSVADRLIQDAARGDARAIKAIEMAIEEARKL